MPAAAASTRARLDDVELLRRLVAFDSTSRHSNLPIADFVADYLDRDGIVVERNPSADGTKTNLVARVGPAVNASREGLVLSGHFDVVPAEEPEWTSDPFTLADRGDAWVGRGAADMKGFVALAVNAAIDAAIDAAASGDLVRTLVLVLTYDEEIGTVGARHFVETWGGPLPRRAIIGEPTSLAVVRLHKGHGKTRLVVRGRSAHSGYPHLGRNAVEEAARAVAALAELRRELETEACPNDEHFPEVPYVALNVAAIHGGTAINIVPERCTVDLGFRVLPGMDAAEVMARIELRCGEVLDGLDGISWHLDPLSESPPMLLPESSDLYGFLCSLVGQTTTVSASYATDAGWLARGGKAAAMDCVVWGPGTIEVAHRPDEWMPKDEYRRGGELLRRAVDRFCRNPR